MKPEQLAALIERLEMFQVWRRGDIDDYDADPTRIGKDLDAAIKILKQLGKEKAGGSPEEPS